MPSFFLFIASCIFSFLHDVLPRSLLRFLLPQSSLQGFKTPSLNEPYTSFASVLTNSFTLYLSFSLIVSFSFNFYTLHCVFHFIFMRLNRFFFFTSTTTNLCCSSQGITLISFKNFLLSFSTKTKLISVSLHLFFLILLKLCIHHT